jgi:hypothetical protein
MTLPPLTYLIGKSLGYILIAAIIPIFIIAYAVAGVLTVVRFVWGWVPGD